MTRNPVSLLKASRHARQNGFLPNPTFCGGTWRGGDSTGHVVPKGKSVQAICVAGEFVAGTSEVEAGICVFGSLASLSEQPTSDTANSANKSGILGDIIWPYNLTLACRGDTRTSRSRGGRGRAVGPPGLLRTAADRDRGPAGCATQSPRRAGAGR